MIMFTPLVWLGEVLVYSLCATGVPKYLEFYLNISLKSVNFYFISFLQISFYSRHHMHVGKQQRTTFLEAAPTSISCFYILLWYLPSKL